MQLDNFTLKIYNDADDNHKKIIEELENDKEGNKFLGNLQSYINTIEKRKEEEFLYNNSYIVYYEDRPIGFLAITHHDEIYEITNGLLKKERGNHLGPKLLKEFTKKTFETRPQIDKLTLVIDNLNDNAKKAVIKVGYNLEYEQTGKQYYSQKRR